jgi:signal peptidase I
MMQAEAYLEPVMSIWAARREKTECRISGFCMVPVIGHGDTLVIQHGRDRIRRGDIIVFRQDGKLAVHRLIRREKTATGEKFYTKGDRRPFFDPPVHPDQVQGKVIESRGAHGALHFTSDFWKVSNQVLALLAYVIARQRPPGMPRKNPLNLFWSRIPAGLLTLQYVLAWALCAIYRLPASRFPRGRKGSR